MEEANLFPEWVRDGESVLYVTENGVRLGPFVVSKDSKSGAVELYTGRPNQVGSERVHAIVGDRVMLVGEDFPIDLSRLVRRATDGPSDRLM